MPLVVCTCSSFDCRSESCINQHGVLQPGKIIGSQLRSKHRAQDSELAVSADSVRVYYVYYSDSDCHYATQLGPTVDSRGGEDRGEDRDMDQPTNLTEIEMGVDSNASESNDLSTYSIFFHQRALFTCWQV